MQVPSTAVRKASLFDPLLYQSSYVNPNPASIFKIDFWKKFNPFNFFFNIAFPIIIIIFVAFVLKARYLAKLAKVPAPTKTSTKVQKQFKGGDRDR